MAEPRVAEFQAAQAHQRLSGANTWSCDAVRTPLGARAVPVARLSLVACPHPANEAGRADSKWCSNSAERALLS